MLVSHRKKFVYTKTVKTAGTSVKSFFEKFCMPDGEWAFQRGREQYVSETGIIGFRGNDHTGRKWYNHMPALEVKNNLGPEIWNSYFKFCCIRNPWDKMVSAFFNFYLKLKGIMPDSDDEKIGCFRDWIKRNRAYLLYDGDRYLIDGLACVDYIIRYEDIENGVRDVCRIIGVDSGSIELPKMKANFRDSQLPYAAFYDSESMKIVKDRYAFEIVTFRYTF